MVIKCLNCGSTAQPRVQYLTNQNDTTITRVITCGCGCEITTHYALVQEIAVTKSGTLISHRKGERKK